MAKGGVQFPANLSSLSDEELTQLETDATAEFEELTAKDKFGAEDLARSTELAEGIEAVRAESLNRETSAAETAAARDALKDRIKKPEAPAVDEPADEGGEPAVEAAPEPAMVASGKTPVENVLKGKDLNPKLSDAQKWAARYNSKDQRTEPVLVASADIRGFTQGGELNGYKDLVKATVARAKTLPDGRGAMNFVPVAQMQREFRYDVDDQTPFDKVHEILQAAASPEALVAAGGWCSPSEISYDYFNIVCEDGMYDLPTIGIRRGGYRWPTSPSFGDLASSTALWVWNETQDIAALTGTAQSGTKTCAHVPCAAYNEARLDCDGVCLTAGNLSTDAWPEQLANYMRLVMAAHAHRQNARQILKVAALATSVPLTGTSAQGTTVPILDSLELMRLDYINKYAMCDDATFEAVFPNWIKGMIRADLAKRKGWDSPGSAFNISDAEIGSWMTQRGIAAQFVQDWQVRGVGPTGAGGQTNMGSTAAATAWPAKASYLFYPAGTYVKGNGMTLDLGVIRDSTLNATNDYTAAWMEDCWLVSNPGHEGRLVTVDVCANGAVAPDSSAITCPAL
jgi:hypothetical protein